VIVTRAIEITDAGLMAYGEALDLQRGLVRRKVSGDERDFLVFVEHPCVITMGRRGGEKNLRISRDELARRGIEVYDVERGGDVTWHGPGQLVGYPIIDIKRAGLGVTDYLRFLEGVLTESLRVFGIEAFVRKGLTGVWTRHGKIAAIGVAVRRWISFHGFALNVNTDPGAFDSIIPCGLSGERVTSMAEVLGGPVEMARVKESIAGVFSGELAARAAAVE
jgi:lipoate-protein ligase B